MGGIKGKVKIKIKWAVEAEILGIDQASYLYRLSCHGRTSSFTGTEVLTFRSGIARGCLAIGAVLPLSPSALVPLTGHQPP